MLVGYVFVMHIPSYPYSIKKKFFFNFQETFVTSSTTLLSGGETFFSSLLSGRHESERDESGAYFIDRKLYSTFAMEP